MDQEVSRLEVEDMQSGLLRPRPAPYAAAYLIFRIDDRKAGRELMRRARPVVASAADPSSPIGDAWATVALTFQGLRALGVPKESLDSFSPEFQQGMAARAHELGDTGENGPEHWEKPLGAQDVHVVLAALASDAQRLADVLDRAKQVYEKLAGIELIWRQECYALPNDRSGSRTASVIPLSREAEFPGQTRMSNLSKRESLFSGTVMRLGAFLRCRSRKCWAATALTRSFANCISGWLRSGSI